jgi:hypothetical protein
MATDPDDATRLLALLVAICGPEISVYRPKVEALVATLKANARLARTAGSLPIAVSTRRTPNDGSNLCRDPVSSGGLRSL